jgi:hypothetical protein
LGTETKMNCNEELAMGMEEDCKLKQFQKNLYYNGKLLTASDFIKESSYINETRHLINRLVLGSGIVCGQKVVKVEKESDKCYCGPDGEPRMVADRWRAEITAGVAIDCVGREIVVSKSGKYFVSEEILPEKFGDKETPFGLYIRRKDRPLHPTPTPANTSCCEEVCCYSHVEEGFELVFDQLHQITKLAFDRTTYSPEDSAFIYLFKPFSVESAETNEVKITNKSTGATTDIMLEKLSKSSVLGVDVYVNRDPFKIVGSAPRPIDEILFAELLSSEGHDARLTATASIVKQRYNKKFEKKRIGRDYYEIWLKECSCCEDTSDPKVLLAALEFGRGNNSLNVDENRTTWHRNIVYNNKMLYDLISCHLVDLEKPATPPPSSVRAIERLSIWRDPASKIQDIGNLTGDTRLVPEIRLIQGEGIELLANRDTGTEYDSITINSKASGTGQISSGVCEISKENFGDDYEEGGIGMTSYILSLPIPHKIQGRKIPGIILGIQYREDPPTSTLRGREIFSMEDLSILLGEGGNVTPALTAGNKLASPDPHVTDEPFPLNDYKPYMLFYKAIRVGFETFQILVVNKCDDNIKWKGQKNPIIHWCAISE